MKNRPELLNTYFSFDDEGNLIKRGNFKVALTPLHMKIRDQLVSTGKCFLTTGEIRQAFSLAWTEEETIEADRKAVKFAMWLHGLNMLWYDIGFELEPDGLLTFGYKVESAIHDNKSAWAKLPLKDEIGQAYRVSPDFTMKELDEQIFIFVNSMASLWLRLYDQHEELQIERIAANLPTDYK